MIYRLFVALAFLVYSLFNLFALLFLAAAVSTYTQSLEMFLITFAALFLGHFLFNPSFDRFDKPSHR